MRVGCISLFGVQSLKSHHLSSHIRSNHKRWSFQSNADDWLSLPTLFRPEKAALPAGRPFRTVRSSSASGGTENKNGESERGWMKEGIKFLSYVLSYV
jgi:hypothetical protein